MGEPPCLEVAPILQYARCPVNQPGGCRLPGDGCLICFGAERQLYAYSMLPARPCHWFLTVTLLGLAVSAVGCGEPVVRSRPAAPAQPPALRPTAARAQPAEPTPSPTVDPPLQVRHPLPGSSVRPPVQIEGTAWLAEG